MKWSKGKSPLLTMLTICLILIVTAQVVFFVLKLEKPRKIQIEPGKAFARSSKAEKTGQTSKQKQQAETGGTTTRTDEQSTQTSLKNMPLADYRAYLEKKERELELKEKQLKEKEAILKALQKDIEEKLAKLEKIQQEIEKYKQEQKQLAGQKLDALVKIYTTMKPKDAASLLEKLDEKLVVEIISRMKTDRAAKIIANMNIKKAAEITKKLSEVKKLPAP